MDRVKLKLGKETETIAGFLLWQVSKLWQRQLTLALRDLNLPSTQAVILANVLRLSEEGLPVTQALLSRATKVDRMTTSQTVRALERKRLVSRRNSNEDLRTSEVQLTPRGRKKAFAAIARLAAAHQLFFRPLRREKRQIVSYLQRLIRANEIAES
ncbi:MarR family transcriptional regulator [Bradyrhizobium sp.]|uniref:MarR family winged helix-turn-helix transcriptional regulator n=1 Tax=Bradyrhizobium sp. TaxID=376 RepID=UPI00260AAE16|nr:MarR family transcriptional regulator [Bradyrhizobium sp.]